MTYQDFPDCLTRYGWLIRDAERNPAMLFNEFEPHHCKACGDPVARGLWNTHRREHAHQLKVAAQRRSREQAARLRTVNRLRAEARSTR